MRVRASAWALWRDEVDLDAVRSVWLRHGPIL